MMRKKPDIGILAARGLGDGLIILVLSHNLKKAGFSVTTYSTPLCQLQEWFPDASILPFDCKEKSHDLLIDAKDLRLDKTQSYVDNLVTLCKERFEITNAEKSNGIVAPNHLIHKKYPNRVVIHPTSSSFDKSWTQNKFLDLKRHLVELGYDVTFAMSYDERKEWPEETPLFETLSHTASYIYESGFLIGNDSGLGHLASSLGIPVLSIFEKKSASRLWRPGWEKGLVVTPPFFLIGGRLKQKWWKNSISVNRVLNTFKKLAR